jgi:hypothetical protein
MTTTNNNQPNSPKRAYRAPGKLPTPPAGVAVVNRIEAAELMGVPFDRFGKWEMQGRVAIPRYCVGGASGREIGYVAADVVTLREEFDTLGKPYPDPERPGVYRVPVRSRLHTMEALIDAADLPKVEGRHWNVSRRGKGGAMEVILSSVSERTVPLKRIIMGVESADCKAQLVCFRNGDPLDLRRENLVVTSFAEKAGSSAKMKVRAGRPVSSAYKGVVWDNVRRVWKAQIGQRPHNYMLGRFRDEAQAAAAYDAAARAMFGTAAVLNFPDGNVPAPTFVGPDGAPVRAFNKYRVPRGLPTPPPGVAMLTREQAAEMLEVATHTFGNWETAGEVDLPRYREEDTTGKPILYAAADIARLKEALDKVGKPYPDPHPCRKGVMRVPLRTLGGYIEALIDEVDLGIVQGKKWNFTTHVRKGPTGGAVIQASANNALKVQLKRLILGLQDEESTTQIVHANGNPLDCRRENLVLHSPSKSTRACFKILARAGQPTTSRFKGVLWSERAGKWLAQINIGEKPKRLGQFDDEEDAAYAYDDAARELWGQEARVNFPLPGELPSAAAPVAPADLVAEITGATATLPGKPTDFAAVLHEDGSVSLSWSAPDAAASVGVTFAVLRRLPGQSEFLRIGTAAGTTEQIRRPTFTDATVRADVIAASGPGAEYIVQGLQAAAQGEASDVVVVRASAAGLTVACAAMQQAA